MALLADQLLGRQEIVRKAVGPPLTRVPYVAGATILGSGRVILILNIPSIIESAEVRVSSRPKIMPQPSPGKKRGKSILLAEDVLSTATIKKNILEYVAQGLEKVKREVRKGKTIIIFLINQHNQ